MSPIRLKVVIEDTVSALAARAEISGLLLKYFAALDARDFDAVGTCFAYDGCFRAGGRTSGRGPTAIAEFVRAGASRFSSSTHLAANIDIAMVDGGADCVTNAIATLILVDRPALLRVRGLRYTDRLRHDDSGWRICEREHTAL